VTKKHIKSKYSIKDKKLMDKDGIKPENDVPSLNNLDKLTPTVERRNLGKFFTNLNVSEVASKYIRDFISPDTIFEPFVGGGSLINPLIDGEIKFIVNDISTDLIDRLKEKYKTKNIRYFSKNFITTSIDEITYNWLAEDNSILLIYSNPPFGTVSTNTLSTKKKEGSKLSRKIKIDYGGLGKEYGKGDLVIPSIGKMIEVIKNRGSGYLAFFSPFGVFCGRHRYVKLLKKLLRDFEFLYGEIFSGDKFHDVKKDKPISLTLWRYNPKINTDLYSLEFNFEGGVIPIKAASLLKEYWSYDNRKKIKGEIAVQGNDRFNVQAPKMIHLKVEKGGSELIKENLKKSIDIKIIPDELAIGLWSLTVGYRSITKYPLYMDNAYVHLPDFNKQESLEILTYVALHGLITEMKNNYTKGKIGIKGTEKSLVFGGDQLTNGVKYLLNEYKDLKVGDFSVNTIISHIKQLEDINELDSSLRRQISREIEQRLEALGYWDYIPVPKGITISD
jgi:hypothetical protein